MLHERKPHVRADPLSVFFFWQKILVSYCCCLIKTTQWSSLSGIVITVLVKSNWLLCLSLFIDLFCANENCTISPPTPVVFLLTFLGGSSIAVPICLCAGGFLLPFFIDDVCFVVIHTSSSLLFCASGRLCFVIMVFPGCPLIFVHGLSWFVCSSSWYYL